MKQKAIESSRLITPSVNQFKVPANKNFTFSNTSNQSQMPLNGVTITPLTTQTTISKTETPQNQNFQPSNKTALPLSNNMSRTDNMIKN